MVSSTIPTRLSFIRFPQSDLAHENDTPAHKKKDRAKHLSSKR